MSGGDGFIQGMDVSKWQSTTPSLVGAHFLIARAGIGTKPDPTYAMHIAAARKAGIITGSYWYNWGSLSVADQVRAYIAAEGDVDLHAIDWEGAEGFTAAQTADFIKRYKAATGNKIALYASEGRFRDLGQDWNWIANYSQEPRKAYDIWQYGLFHGADGNFFKGTLAELRALAGKPATEDEVSGLRFRFTESPPLEGITTVVDAGTGIIRVFDGAVTTVPVGEKREAIKVQLTTPLDAQLGWSEKPGQNRVDGYLISKRPGDATNIEAAFVLAANVTFVPNPPQVVEVPTGITQADLDAAVAAGKQEGLDDGFAQGQSDLPDLIAEAVAADRAKARVGVVYEDAA